MRKYETLVEQKNSKELVDIYLKSQDYQPDFIKTVEAELIKRNIPLDTIKQVKEESDTINDNKIKLGVKGNSFYIVICFISSLTGGVIAIVAGYIYAFSKRKNSQGVAYYYYNEQTRNYGKWIGVAGLLMLAFLLIMIIIQTP
jgi:hypothetical protein